MANAKDRRRERRAKVRASAKKETESAPMPPSIPEPLTETREGKTIMLDGPPPVSVKEALEEALGSDVVVKAPLTPERKMEAVAVEMYQPMGGAQSWEELDDYLEAEDMASATRQATYEFQQLVSNVLNDGERSLSEKGSAISALANGLPERVGDIQDEKEVEEDGWLEKLRGAISGKAELTRASINDLPDSAFAYIEPGGEKDEDGKTNPRSLRHYPIHDAVHIRNALSRAQQQINRGGKSGEIARKALPKIRAAAKRMKIGQSAKDFNTHFEVFKDAQAGWRWFGWVSNKFRDRDQEIITEAAHKDFVAWVDKDPIKRMPQLWAWHTKQTAHEHRWDWIDYADGFLMGSGPLTEKEAEALNRLSERYELGMSHGFYPVDRDPSDRLITKYRSFEGSHLPVEHAANPWTDIVAAEKEADPMGLTPEKKKYLAQLAGEGFVNEIEADTATKAEELEKAGVDYKASEEEAPSLDIKALAETLAKELGMEELGTVLAEQAKSIKGLQETVVALQKSDDEKVAEQMRPRIDASVPLWKRRLSQSDETAVQEKEVEQPSVQGGDIHWLAQAIGPREENHGAVPR